MKPLAGTRVLDLSRLLPGGFCTMVLADLGAEVIKVEEPGSGDPIRRYTAPSGRAVFFDALHRGKRSLTLDLRSVEGRTILLRLAAAADVLVEGFRPGALPFASASAGGRPALPALQSADLGAGALTAVTAILAALLERQRTGTGQVLDIGMAPGLLPWLALPAAELLEGGSVPAAGEATLNGGLACYGVYPTADGHWLSVAALEPKFWAALCTLLERPAFIARQMNPGDQAAMRADLEALFATRTLAEWEAFFGDADVCVAPALGADTEALLEDLGIPGPEREPLRHRGVI